MGSVFDPSATSYTATCLNDVKGIVQKINFGFQNKQFLTLILIVKITLLTKNKELRKVKKGKEKYKDQLNWLYPLADWLTPPPDWLNPPAD